VWIIQDEKESDPMLIFLTGNRPKAIFTHAPTNIKKHIAKIRTRIIT
jgi:hypothetical protein